MRKSKKLTPRQWALHNLIKEADGRRLSKFEICQAIEAYHYRPNSSDACSQIRDDARAINLSSECDMIIAFDRQEYYEATEEQALSLKERKEKTIRTAAEEIRAIKRKLLLNGQGKLLNNAGNPLREGNEEFHATVREPSSMDAVHGRVGELPEDER